MKSEGVVTIVLDPKVKKAVKGLAKADDRSLSSYISRLLAQHVAEKLSQNREQTA